MALPIFFVVVLLLEPSLRVAVLVGGGVFDLLRLLFANYWVLFFFEWSFRVEVEFTRRGDVFCLI